jgi:hypothetical protein
MPDLKGDTTLHKYETVEGFNLVIFEEIYLLGCNAM